MAGAILVINAGSSSIKFSLYLGGDGARPALDSHGQVEGIHVSPHFAATDPDGRILAERRWSDSGLSHETLFTHLIDWIETRAGDARLLAAGHRVVHGGARHEVPVVVDDGVLAELEALVPLAPLHQPHNLAPIRALRRLHPGLSQVACFDTAFHHGNPAVAQHFAIPRALTDEGVRRYGFHGLSYEYVGRRLAEIAPAFSSGRVVVAHLGSGASICAMAGGRSIASTMGFTALDGIPMGTRPGAIDPGVILYLMREKGMGADAIETLLYQRSGLLGVSEISSDMRVLLTDPDARAVEAIDLFVYRVCRELGSLAAALEGLDALVFTAGIGEHAPEIRRRICERSGWLGIRLDGRANACNARTVSASDSAVPVFVIPTDEEMMIAEHTLDLVGNGRSGA